MSITGTAPEGNYLYIVVGRADYFRMMNFEKEPPTIGTILFSRSHYKPCNMHFTARDALAHYLALKEAGDESD